MEKYNRLVALANIYARQYYYIGHSDISDAEYDNLVANIEALEVNQGLSSDISPTQRVGWYERLSSNSDIDFKHLYQKCLSLGNVRTNDELHSFLDKDVEVIVTPKLDGCAGMLYYSSGLLTNVVTRGDGITGKDITHLSTYIDGIPLKIDIYSDIRIEGEFLCKTFNTSMGKNQRNYVAGSLGLKSTEDMGSRGISFTSYNVVYKDNKVRPYTYEHILKDLVKNELSCVPYYKYPDSHDLSPDVLDTDALKSIFSKTYSYTDGLVYKFNSTNKWDDFTRHHPKFAIAFKFAETEYQTKLLGVQWQVGKSRQVTPVAILEPVNIEGTVVQRASLANVMNIKARGIKLFDIVNVIRAGSVIPQIVSVYKEAKDREDIKCTVCPSCSSKLSNRNGLLFCDNVTCQDAVQKLLENFISIIGVKGLGPATIKRLKNDGAVTSVLDFFTLDKKTVIESGEVSTKLVSSILNNIENAKSKPRSTMWAALGIPRLGVSVAETIMEKFNSLEHITEEELVSVPRIGQKTAEGIILWLRDNKDTLIKLESIFTNTSSNITKGTVVLTGTMDRPRTEIAADLKNKGWKISSSVTRKVTFLIYGKNPGSKLDKARTLKIKTLDYFGNISNLD